MPPITITRAGPLAVPFTYPLGPAETFRPEVISAIFNGAGAGASFWPCCSVYTQDGKLRGRFIPPASVPAGDTAEVTYGPF